MPKATNKLIDLRGNAVAESTRAKVFNLREHPSACPDRCVIQKESRSSRSLQLRTLPPDSTELRARQSTLPLLSTVNTFHNLPSTAAFRPRTPAVTASINEDSQRQCYCDEEGRPSSPSALIALRLTTHFLQELI
jgi:hypothetical protein